MPPAQLPLERALAVHAQTRSGPYGAMVGDFLVPSSRLDELAAAGNNIPPQITVILDRHVETALRAIDAVPALPINAVETPRGVDATRGDMLEMLGAWAEKKGERCRIYFEVVAAGTAISRVDDGIERLALARMTSKSFAAKIATGGMRPGSAPSDEIVVHTFAECTRHNVPLKATAGLQQPIRTTREGFPLHGFLNLLLAAAIAFRDSEATEAMLEALAEDDPAAFVMEDDALTWRERRFGAATLAGMRSILLTSFGNSTLTEPVEGLRSLGLIA